MRLFAQLLAATTLIFGVSALDARADPDDALPVKASEKMLAELAKADLDSVATDAGKYMGSDVAESIKNNFASVKNLGQSQYTDLVYSRDYGKTTRDFIYKIDFEKAFAYVRFLWEVDNGNWRLVHFQYKTDNDLPFPGGWEHIYPK
jgi:hypothetical protein